ncbi:MAG: alpha/beta fold hydrolase [Proteobacteria bacterium]|nr:alpha/beta fold hydrolase [Pseudomonadota bacterium]
MSQVLTTPKGVPFVRTPEAAFDDIEEFPYASDYVTFEGLRLHYIDVGPVDGPVALLMHGMPTWSYLNRHIIDVLAAEGWRCIAADHIGFGRSDKVIDDGWYSIARHVAAHRTLIEALDLQDITLFCQDWGGPIGLAQAADMPRRFERLVVMNTWLHHDGYEYTEALRRWNAQWQADGVFGANIPERLSLGWFMMLPLGQMEARDLFAIIEKDDYPDLSPEAEAVRHAYDAPFDGLGPEGYAGVRRFPLSLPFYNPDGGAAESQALWFEALTHWRKPIHFIWGGSDAVFTEAWGRQWAGLYRQATFDVLPGAGHFLQETHGGQIAAIFLRRVAEETRD